MKQFLILISFQILPYQDRNFDQWINLILRWWPTFIIHWNYQMGFFIISNKNLMTKVSCYSLLESMVLFSYANFQTFWQEGFLITQDTNFIRNPLIMDLLTTSFNLQSNDWSQNQSLNHLPWETWNLLH